MADTLDSKDFLSIKQDLLTSLPFPRCGTPKQDIVQYCQNPFRTVKGILAIVSAFLCQKTKLRAQNIAEGVSIQFQICLV